MYVLNELPPQIDPKLIEFAAPQRMQSILNALLGGVPVDGGGTITTTDANGNAVTTTADNGGATQGATEDTMAERHEQGEQPTDEIAGEGDLEGRHGTDPGPDSRDQLHVAGTEEGGEPAGQGERTSQQQAEGCIAQSDERCDGMHQRVHEQPGDRHGQREHIGDAALPHIVDDREREEAAEREELEGGHDRPQEG